MEMTPLVSLTRLGSEVCANPINHRQGAYANRVHLHRARSGERRERYSIVRDNCQPAPPPPLSISCRRSSIRIGTSFSLFSLWGVPLLLLANPSPGIDGAGETGMSGEGE